VSRAEELHAGRARLLLILADLSASGCRIPCVDATDPTPWTSEDPAAQTLAAKLCIGCSGFVDCRSFIERWPRESGVYAASTEVDRKTRTGRPRKATTTTTEGSAA